MSRTSKTNHGLFIAIVFVLALAPVPLASNRPFFWSLNGFVVALIALVYLVTLKGDFTRLRVPLKAVRGPAILFAATIVWLVVQLLPLPHLVETFWSSGSAALGEELPARISVDPAATIGMTIRFLTYALLFFLVMQATANPDRSKHMLIAIFWIVVVHCVIAILMLFEFGDRLLIFPKWAYEGFATGFFVNRNSFATMAALGMATGTVLALGRSAPIERGGGVALRLDSLGTLLVYGGGLAIIATAIAFSASRMGAFVAALGIGVAFVFALLRSPGRRGAILAALLGVVALVAVIAVVSGANLVERVGSLETSADERLTLYGQVLGMIGQRPWSGYGGGTFPLAFPVFHSLPLSADVTWDAAHSLYLELFADLGFIAVFPILAVLIILARLLAAAVDRETSWAAPTAAIAAIMIGGVHSLVDFSLQIQANGLIFVALIATGTAQEFVGRQRRGRNAAPDGIPPVASPPRLA